MSLTKPRLLKSAIISVMSFVSCISVTGQTVQPFKITELKVVNYNQYNHVFKDVSEEENLEYWNALGTSVVVSAIVSAKPNTYVSGRRVEFKVYEGKKLIRTHSGEIGYFRSDNYYVPIMLYGPFCQPLTIKARIIGQRQISTISRTLNFACGE